MKKRIVLTLVVLFCLILGIVGIVSATQLNVSSAVNVQKDTNAGLNASIQYPGNISLISIYLDYDPTVMSVNSVTPNSTCFTDMGGSYIDNVNGRILFEVAVKFPYTDGVDATSPFKIFDVDAKSLKKDGSGTNLVLSMASGIGDVESHDISGSFTGHLNNGRFSTLDETAPLITFISPTNTSTVAESFTINATVLDMGGVDTTPGSIVLTVGGAQQTVSVNPTNGTTVWVNVSVVSTTANNVPIAILAHDLSGKTNTTQILVNVAHEGVTFTSPLEGFSYNSTPTLRADFVLVNGSTIKMYINGTDVTSSCTVVGGAGTIGSITLNLSYAIAEGQDIVKVNGTYTNPRGYDANSSVTFYKDTIAPIVKVTSITDSDGDLVNEAGELLTISYTVTDTYPDSVWIGTASNTAASGTLLFDPAHGNLVGNQNLTVHAVDRALNSNQSASFHVYNNYLAYYNDPSLGTFAGLDLSKTAVYDIFTDNTKAFTLYGPPSNLTTPIFGVFQKNMTGGSKVVIDYRGNNSIPAGSLPGKIDVYTTPSGTLDFNISVANIRNATIMIVKGNSSIVQRLLHGGGMGGLTQSISQNRIVMYGWTDNPYFIYGYDILDATNSSHINRTGGSGSMKLTPSSIGQTIKDNSLDISSGFNTSEKPDLQLPPLQISALDKGEYVIAAVCLDSDRFGIIAEKTFFVTDPQGAVLGTDASSYVIGNNVTVMSTAHGDTLAAIVVNKTSVYTGIMDLDMQTLGSSSLKDLTLYADGNTTVKKLFGSKPIWITKGSGGFAKDNATLSVNVSTTDFLPGLYTVYMFLENGGNLTAVGQKTVTISYEQPVTPASVTVNVFNATGDNFVADSIRLSNTTPWESMVVNQNTATFSGLANGTTYQVMVNRTGFLNVSATITAVNGQRNVTVNLTQLGQLITPKVVVSENNTVISSIEQNYLPPTGWKKFDVPHRQSETFYYNLTISGNDALAIGVEYPKRLTLNVPDVTMDGQPLDYDFVDGTFTVDFSTRLFTSTNATILVHGKPNSDQKVIRIRLDGLLLGDTDGDGIISMGDVSYARATYVRKAGFFPLVTYDYGDVYHSGLIDMSSVSGIRGSFAGKLNY